MNFRVIQRHDLEYARSPFRVTQQNGPEVDWVNRFLDQQRVRSVAETTLRSYAYDLLHFLRWWVGVNHTIAITEKALAASALLDYIRFQTNQQPRPAAASINRRVGTAERALRLAFPDAPAAFLPDFQYGYWRPRPLSAGPPRPALSRLRVRTPKRVIVPLSNQEVARFWAGFRTSRDLAMVGLMLFDGLRSGEVRTLNRDDLLLSEAQLRVHGKGGNRAACLWLPKSCNCWITTCSWSGPLTAVRLCSSISKAPPGVGASRQPDCAPCSAITANLLRSPKPTHTGFDTHLLSTCSMRASVCRP